MKKYEYDAVVAFAFGAPADIPPNRAIVERVKQIALRYPYNLPIAAQHEVFPKVAMKNVYCLDDGRRHVSTLWLVRRLRDVAPVSWQERKLLVVAAPPHIKRCVRDLRQCGFKAEPDREFANIYPPDFWFCRESTQWWTRSPRMWRIREAVLWRLPWRLYEWVAG